ncbi:natural killer cells antigen CD94-like [Erpetoichthys calabaricus]|uniref:natural killer cells antigen CD94-like n=1 Tax=Erpetoichthys calabaricus TaxID=27687 RepID=UPI00223403D1|nr:natural killer cells antigen CD94-like [Erpetoichthys calabaricus]
MALTAVMSILLTINIIFFILVIQKTDGKMNNESKLEHYDFCNINSTTDECIRDLTSQLQECKSDINKGQHDCNINGCVGLDILKDHLKKTCNKEVVTGDMNCSFCPFEWLQNFNKCYLISTENKTWMDSRNFCISHKADLVMIKEKSELEFLQNILKNAEGFYWIGLRKDSSQIWKWVDASPLDRYAFQNVFERSGTHACISKRNFSSGLGRSKKMCICERPAVII